MHNRTKLALIAVVAAVSCVTAVVVNRTLIHRGQRGDPATPNLAAGSPDTFLKGSQDVKTLVLAIQSRLTARIAEASLSASDRQQIAGLTAEMLHLYRDGTFEQFDQWLRDNTLPPMPEDAPTPGRSSLRDVWKRHKEMLAEAEPNASEAKVFFRSGDGKFNEEPPLGGRSQGTLRASSRVAAAGERDVDLDAYNGLLVEVTVPMTLLLDGDRRVTSRVGVNFAKRADGTWIPVGVKQYGLPMGVGLPNPPL